MRFFRWTIRGREITTLEWGEAEIEAIEDLEGISGGSAQNFERDSNPADPDDRYRYNEFGFR